MSLRCFNVFVLAVFFSCSLSALGQDAIFPIAAGLSSPRQAISSREYDLSAAIARYVELHDAPEEKSRAEAILQIFAPFAGSSPVKWEETSRDTFRVVGNKASHQMVSGIAQWMLHDYKQVCIETRFLSVSEETLKQIHRQFGTQWEMNRPDAESPTTFGSPFETVSAATAPETSQHETNRENKRLVAVSSTTRSLPCRVVKLTPAQTESLFTKQQGDAQTNVINAPKVTLFPGQHAVVKDVTCRPFVVSVKPNDDGTVMQPIIEVLEDGLTVDLKADLLQGNKLSINSAIKFNHIGDVDTFTFDTDELKGVTVQIPVQHTQNVSLDSNLEDGQTLLVDPHFFTEETVKRRFRKDKTVRKYTLILVTPRIIVQEEELAKDTSIAKL